MSGDLRGSRQEKAGPWLQYPGDGSGAAGRAWQAVLACRSRGRAAVDAAPGHRSAARGRAPARRGGCAHLESRSRARAAREGILYPRWRPLLDGPLFGAFGPFAMDGSVTPRAEMAGKVAKWANAHPEAVEVTSSEGRRGTGVRSGVGDLFNYVQQGGTEYYAQSIRGAYQAFFDSEHSGRFCCAGEYRRVQAGVSSLSGDAEEGDGGPAEAICAQWGNTNLRRAAGLLRRPWSRGDGAAELRTGCSCSARARSTSSSMPDHVRANDV